MLASGRLLAVAVVALILSMPARAAFEFGTVAVASSNVGAFPNGIASDNGVVQLLNANGSFTGVVGSQYVAFDVMFDSQQQLWTSGWSNTPHAYAISERWSSKNTREATLPFGLKSPVFDAAGNVYALQGPLEALPQIIRKLSPDGAVVATFAIPQRNAMSMDLAADQCTMFLFYDSPAAIGRYDVCRAVALSDVPIDPAIWPQYIPRVASFRILRDDSLLLPLASEIVRVQQDGTVIRRYSVPGPNPFTTFVAVALDGSGTRFWVAASQQRIFLLDLATGDLVNAPTTEFSDIDAITVAGEPRAAVAAPASVPTLSSCLSWVVAALLLCVAIRQLPH